MLFDFRNFIVPIIAAATLLLAGCATAPQPIPATSHAAITLPADCLVTQRAVLTARGRQFALNGYMAQSASGGRRLIITEMFGKVMADVLVKPDGTIHVMRSGPLFRAEWISHFVVADMQCLFDGKADPQCTVRSLGATHFAIERRWYKLDLQIVQTAPGAQPPDLFDESKVPKQ